MPRRLLALAALALAGVLATGCADDVAPAARVNGATVTTAEFQDELDEWVGNDGLLQDEASLAGAPGAYQGDLVRSLLAQRIDFLLGNEEFEEQGLVIDDSMREQVITVVFGDAAEAERQLAGFSDAYADQVLDDLARQIGLTTALGDEGYIAWRTEAYAESDIEISPRYGTWDGATGTVLAPPTPLSGPAGT